MADPIIAEATGYAGGNNGPVGPLVENAMSQAVDLCRRLGVADDTPHERLVDLVGQDQLVSQLGAELAETAIGADYIREAKLAARASVLNQHRGLIKAHEGGKAAALHNARDA